LELFSNLLGPKVSVDREENIVNGSRRCVYRIRRGAPQREAHKGTKGEARN
jgi:predicted ArsR family transcriptional regulator